MLPLVFWLVLCHQTLGSRINTKNLNKPFHTVSLLHPFEEDLYPATTIDYVSKQTPQTDAANRESNHGFNHGSTLSYRMLENSTSIPESKPEIPLNHCYCRCNSAAAGVEEFKVDREKFQAKLLATSTEMNVAQALDSLIYDDEKDYDDLEELENLQKPNKCK